MADGAVAADDAADDAAHATAVQGSHLEAQNLEVEDQCTEQNSAVHSRLLLEEGHCSHLHDDYIEMTRENHLDLDCDCLLCLDRAHHLEEAHHTHVVDTADSLAKAQTAEEGVVADSCTGWQPFHQLVRGWSSFSLKESRK